MEKLCSICYNYNVGPPISFWHGRLPISAESSGMGVRTPNRSAEGFGLLRRRSVIFSLCGQSLERTFFLTPVFQRGLIRAQSIENTMDKRKRRAGNPFGETLLVFFVYAAALRTGRIPIHLPAVEASSMDLHRLRGMEAHRKRF